MLNRRSVDRRWRWIILIAAAVAAAATVGVIGATAAWNYLKYPDAEHRLATRHLDKVTAEGYRYVGEDVDEYNSVSRFWIKQASPASAPLPQYAHRPLRTDTPGRDSLSVSRYEQELGWLSLPGDNPRCGLSAFRVLQIDPALDIELSAADRAAVAHQTATLIRVVVTCGAG